MDAQIIEDDEANTSPLGPHLMEAQSTTMLGGEPTNTTDTYQWGQSGNKHRPQVSSSLVGLQEPYGSFKNCPTLPGRHSESLSACKQGYAVRPVQTRLPSTQPLQTLRRSQQRTSHHQGMAAPKDSPSPSSTSKSVRTSSRHRISWEEWVALLQSR